TTSAGLATVSVKNSGAAVIPAGSVVSLEPGSTAVVIGEEQVVLYVKNGDATYKHYCGIALTAMGLDGGGAICMMGPVLCRVSTNDPSAPAFTYSIPVDVALDSNQVVAHGGDALISDQVIRGVALENMRSALTVPDFGGATNQQYAYCWMN